MANSSGYENVTNTMNQISRLPMGVAVFLSASNIFLSIIASVGNALILIALRKVSSIHPPTKLLFRCLAVSDLCVGLLLQPLFVTRLLNDVTQKINWNIVIYIIVANACLSLFVCGISVLVTTAISVDRLLAVMLRLRYRQVVTLRRVRVGIFCFCLSTVLSSGLMGYFVSFRIALTWAIVWVLLCFVVSVFCYAKIFLRLRQQQAQVQDFCHQVQPNEGETPLNIARYKRTVSSIAWVQMTLVACYVPLVIVSMLHNNNPTYNDIEWSAVVTLFYLNSSLNPMLYCWRIAEMRQAVKDTVTQFCCA